MSYSSVRASFIYSFVDEGLAPQRGKSHFSALRSIIKARYKSTLPILKRLASVWLAYVRVCHLAYASQSPTELFFGQFKCQYVSPWVTAILNYNMEIHGNRPGLFFVDLSHNPLIKLKYVIQIWNILNSLGMQQDQYAGHSFRIGTATTVTAVGVEDSTIQALGR